MNGFTSECAHRTSSQDPIGSERKRRKLMANVDPIKSHVEIAPVPPCPSSNVNEKVRTDLSCLLFSMLMDGDYGLLMGIRSGGRVYVQDRRRNVRCRVCCIQRHWTCVGLVAEKTSNGARIEGTGPRIGGGRFCEREGRGLANSCSRKGQIDLDWAPRGDS